MNSVPVVVGGKGGKVPVVVGGNGGNVAVDTEKLAVDRVGSVNVGRPLENVGRTVENVGGLTVVVTNISGAKVLGGSG